MAKTKREASKKSKRGADPDADRLGELYPPLPAGGEGPVFPESPATVKSLLWRLCQQLGVKIQYDDDKATLENIHIAIWTLKHVEFRLKRHEEVIAECRSFMAGIHVKDSGPTWEDHVAAVAPNGGERR